MPQRRYNLDMSWGSPDFLAYYWKDINFDSEHIPLKYHYGSKNELKVYIEELHKKVSNAETRGKYVVIGNGASQILIGLMMCLKDPVFALAPYFTRFPSFAKLAGVEWGEGRQIVTAPNNPDNSFPRFYPHDGIYDLSYNWPQYTKCVPFNEDIMVYSLSKATGHASTRIGWAILSDKKLAKALESYIEISSGGVSMDAQYKALNVIKHQLESHNTIFKYGTSVLKKRWRQIRECKFPFKVLNNDGMFLWCKGDIPYGIDGLQGTKFGKSNKYFRLNIGCSKKIFDKFIGLYDK